MYFIKVNYIVSKYINVYYYFLKKYTIYYILLYHINLYYNICCITLYHIKLHYSILHYILIHCINIILNWIILNIVIFLYYLVCYHIWSSCGICCAKALYPETKAMGQGAGGEVAHWLPKHSRAVAWVGHFASTINERGEQTPIWRIGV